MVFSVILSILRSFIGGIVTFEGSMIERLRNYRAEMSSVMARRIYAGAGNGGGVSSRATVDVDRPAKI